MGKDDGREVDLAETFGEIARTLLAENDAQATLDQIVFLAVKTIDACEHAGITVIDGQKVTSPASSDEIPALVDKIQAETHQGPCVDAIQDHEVFQTGKLSEEGRWPDFARRANTESGIESILSFRLFAAEETMGALNLYSTQPDAFDEHDVAVGSVFAAHAAVAWSTSRTVQNLKVGMESRQMIGTAVGLLMARQHLPETEAFNLLVRASQRLNIKLRSVADQLVHPQTGPPSDRKPSQREPLDDVAPSVSADE